MASITKLGRGKQPPRAIDFVDDTEGGKRKRIRLGVTSHDFAEEVCRRVEQLLSAKLLNQGIGPATAEWLAGVSDTLHERIAQKGLCQSRQPATKAPKLEIWLTKYIGQRGSDLKPGSIDRLLIAPDRVLIVDYKSNAVIPDRPDQVPEGILRQMGAYAHMLGQIYPDRRIDVAILWTRGPHLMPLDPEIVRQAFGRTAFA